MKNYSNSTSVVISPISYGIYLASSCGLEPEIIQNARLFREQLEKRNLIKRNTTIAKKNQNNIKSNNISSDKFDTNQDHKDQIIQHLKEFKNQIIKNELSTAQIRTKLSNIQERAISLPGLNKELKTPKIT